MKVEIFILLILLVTAALSQQEFDNPKCPGFDYLFHFGDGVTDIGNSVLVLPSGNSLPAALPPYGMTLPGAPNGRWSDGLIDFDFAASDFGIPNIVPYLSNNFTNGIIFSVARSPVLDSSFFIKRGVQIEPFAVSLRDQMKWFKTYLRFKCRKSSDCIRKIMDNSLVLLGDIEGNDIGYALSQGKSISEVRRYVPAITKEQIRVSRELAKMGCARIIIPGTVPLGCYPYILTTMQTKNASAYDDLGCLKEVNDLVTYKNNDLERAINNLRREFPDVDFFYGPFGTGVLDYIRQMGEKSVKYAGGKRNVLKSCCGIGGRYNYDPKRFCGGEGVPTCSNPDDYVFWDGLHFTHMASYRIEQMMVVGALANLNCTPILTASF